METKRKTATKKAATKKAVKSVLEILILATGRQCLDGISFMRPLVPLGHR